MRTKSFLILDLSQTRLALIWLAGFFAYAALLGLFQMLLPDLFSNGLRRYSFQIFLAIALFFLWRKGWRPVWRCCGRSFWIPFGFLAVYFFCLWILNFICKTEEDPVLTFLPSSRNFQDLMLLALVAPVLEELFFRDLILRALYSRFARFSAAVLLSSLFFMIAHQTLHGGAFVLGLVNGILFLASESILGPIVFHSVSNLSWYFLPIWFPHFFQKLVVGNWLHFFYK
ncbi:MAG: CPBP family intramembrane metalloprotease [Deltaproteobacteria bacterium]|nr:CPBP family intramembrane metalloprotease [Deltaproteobacteria bacterium]